MHKLNWPNRISLTRILLVIPLFICLLNLNSGWPYARHFALGLVMVMSVSDFLDGYLARKLRQESALGRFLDPLADKLLIACAVVLLSVESTAVAGFVLPIWVPVLVLGKDVVIVAGYLFVHLSVESMEITPRLCGKACTAVQLAMVVLVLMAPDLPAVLQVVVPAAWWAAGALAIVATLDYLAAGNKYATQCTADSQQAEKEDSDDQE